MTSNISTAAGAYWPAGRQDRTQVSGPKHRVTHDRTRIDVSYTVFHLCYNFDARQLIFTKFTRHTLQKIYNARAPNVVQ